MVDEQRAVRVSGLTVEHFPDDAALVHSGGRVHELNAAGARILEALDGRSLHEVAEAIAVEVGEPVASISADVRGYAVMLARAGLAKGTGLPPPDPIGVRWPSLPPPLPPPGEVAVPPAGAIQTSVFEAFGHHFAVRSPDVELIRYVDELLAPFATASSPQHMYDVVRDGQEWAVRIDGERGLSTPRLWLVLAWLFWHFTQQAIATVPDRLLLHAALLELDGRGLVLCGRMNSGKSTLAGALVERGWRYHSDEVVVLEEQGGSPVVSGFPRPLVVEGGSQRLLSGLRPPPSWRARFRRKHWHLPLAPPELAAVPLAALVIPIVDAGKPARLEPAQAATLCRLLWENTWNSQSVGGAGFALLARGSRSVPCAHLRHGDLDVAEIALRRLILGDWPPQST